MLTIWFEQQNYKTGKSQMSITMSGERFAQFKPFKPNRKKLLHNHRSRSENDSQQTDISSKAKSQFLNFRQNLTQYLGRSNPSSKDHWQTTKSQQKPDLKKYSFQLKIRRENKGKKKIKVMKNQILKTVVSPSLNIRKVQEPGRMKRMQFTANKLLDSLTKENVILSNIRPINTGLPKCHVDPYPPNRFFILPNGELKGIAKRTSKSLSQKYRAQESISPQSKQLIYQPNYRKIFPMRLEGKTYDRSKFASMQPQTRTEKLKHKRRKTLEYSEQIAWKNKEICPWDDFIDIDG